MKAIKQLLTLIKKSNKLWIVPIVLLLIIITLLVIAAQVSPVPLFIYPIL